MSADPSPPPSPDDAIQGWLTRAETLIALIVENFRRGTWVKRLLLLDALIVFALNARVVTAGLRTFALLGEDEKLPDWYDAAFWTTVGVLFLTALLVAWFTPTVAKVETIDLSERKAIKGLRPFTADDAEIFAKLQRNRSLRECLEAITSENFRFGILMGEAGSGKTSFLQAGVVPELTEPESDYRAVYVRFSDRPPLNAIQDDLAKQLHIAKDHLNSTDLVLLLQTAVAAIDKPLILFFDQFEQFFVHASRKPDRQPFIQALTAWYHSDLPVRLLVCMRGDMVDRLVELHQALGYALSPQEVFRLEKFSPEEATKVLQVIAETEKLRFEESFVRELAERELADREDGAISPVDLQILGWMIERQNADELRAFNQQAFQKFGGVEGLMTRFLEKTLEARVIKSQRETAVKVLLALTDLDRNVRAGALSLTELQDKLKDTVKADEVAEAVGWLVRGDVRLITPEEKAEETVYELAHERLIPAVRKVAGQELTEVQKANELLDRRANEWEGNDFSSRYLFSPVELWKLKRQQPYLEWGANRSPKKQLWRKSWQRLHRTIGALALVLLVLLSGWGWLLTPTGQRWQMWRELAELSEKVNDEGRSIATTTFAQNTNFQQADKICDSIQNERYKAYALSVIAEVYGKLNNPKAPEVINAALISAKQIQDESDKAYALGAIAKASGKLNNSQALEVLDATLTTAKQIQNERAKFSALVAIAKVSGEINNSQALREVLNAALATAKQIQDESSESDKAYALSVIAEVYGKLNNPKAPEVINAALVSAKQIQNESDKAYALGTIAKASGKLNNSQALEVLDATLTTAKQIQNEPDKAYALSVIAEVYGKLDNPKAPEVINAALAAAKQIQDESSESDKAYALSVIAEGHSKLNNPQAPEEALDALDDALATAKQLQDESDKSYALGAIAEAYAKLDNWRQARQAVESCPSNGCRVNSLAAALTVWAEQQHPELAEEEE